MEVRVYTDNFSGQTQIAFMQERDGRLYVAEPFKLVFKEVDMHSSIEPSLKIDRRIANEFLQELSDSLNRAGFISDKVDGYKLELGATKYHLEDMRKIVFDKKIEQ